MPRWTRSRVVGPQQIGGDWPLDPIGWFPALRASLRPLRIIADSTLDGPFADDQLPVVLAEVHRTAGLAGTLQDKVAGLWRLEKIAYAWCRHGRGRLRVEEFPTSLWPILHVGLGVAAAEHADFVPDRVVSIIDDWAHPGYRAFAFEAVGCIWAISSSRRYRPVFELVSRLRIRTPNLPGWREMLEAVPAEARRYLAHGYGRALYFQHLNVPRALRRALAVPGLDAAAAAQGIAFAYAMLHCRDVARVLEVGASWQNPLAGGFRHGLVYVLAFWEWAYRGCLDLIAPGSTWQASLLADAEALIARSREVGTLETSWPTGTAVGPQGTGANRL